MMSINETKKSKKRGRPAVDSEAVNLRLRAEMVECIDDFRRLQADLPSRPEAIRRLIDLGLEASKREAK